MSILQAVSLMLFIVMIISIFKYCDTNEIKKDKKLQHTLFGFSTLLFFLWILRISIHEALFIHFLGLTTLTLVLGFRWAIISASGVLFILTVLQYESWPMFGINAIIGIIIPISITYAIFSITFHRLPRQPFVYLFLCGFFPGAITIATKMILLSAYYSIDSSYSWHDIYNNYTVLTILMLFPESFFNGFLMTSLVMYKPDLVSTFNDKFYLNGK